jgi:inorganic pyrophosphatase
MTDLLALPTSAGAEEFHVVIESPRGSTLKLKYDPNLRAITLSRPLTVGLAYPYDWGFVPSTEAPDGDPLDAIVMWDGSSYPGVVLACRAIGVLCVEQTNPATRERERNDRIVALPTKARRFDSTRSVFDISERHRLELERFFLTSVAFEGKDLMILGWAGPNDALTLVRSCQKENRVAHGRA